MNRNPPRRWWQFSLRFLLIVIAVSALGMHWRSEWLAVRHSQSEFESTQAAYESGVARPEVIIQASRKLVEARLNYLFCDHQSELKRHRDCMERTFLAWYANGDCYMGAATEKEWREVDAELMMIRKFGAEAERWLAAGKIVP